MRPGSLIVVAAALAGAPLFAQAPAGPEITVNTDPSGEVQDVSVGSRANGDFVVVWTARYGPEPNEEIRVSGQRFDRAGTRVGSVFQVMSTTSGTPFQPIVSCDANGGFAVVWSQGLHAAGRRYDANGPTGPVFPLSTTQDSGQAHVASAPSGAFIAVWDGSDGITQRITGQRFDAGGTRVGAEFFLDSPVAGSYGIAGGITLQDDGQFIATWTRTGAGEQYDVVARRLAADGSPVGAEFTVNNGAPNFRAFPSVAAVHGGGYVVAWLEGDESLRQPIRFVTRRYLADDTPLAFANVAHTNPPNNPEFGPPGLATLGVGPVLAWSYARDGAHIGLRLRTYEATGMPDSPPYDFASPDVPVNFSPRLSADGAGNLVAAWRSMPQGSGRFEVHAQRFSRLSAPALAVDTAPGPTSDGNRVLEAGETVDLRPSWRNATGSDQALDGALAGITGPAGATYTIVDGSGSYGVVPSGATQACTDCYSVSVSASSRPLTHWDAAVEEGIDGGAPSRIRWALHVGGSFTDVARGRPTYRFVETLLHRGVTTGCGDGTTFCPASSVTRAQMAVFALRAGEEPGYVPIRCSDPPRYGDVPASSPFCPWIEELAFRGIAGGCAATAFCPDDPVTREQTALIVVRMIGPAIPPACTTPRFSDVPASSPFCRWIEEMARRGITGGCGGGKFCPQDPVTREQMAVFLTTAFGLTLYGP